MSSTRSASGGTTVCHWGIPQMSTTREHNGQGFTSMPTGGAMEAGGMERASLSSKSAEGTAVS
eukprot:15471194-Alexandrium_andersonii.AAC.1